MAEPAETNPPELGPSELEALVDEYADADLDGIAAEDEAEGEGEDEPQGQEAQKTQGALRVLPLHLTSKRATRGRPREIKRIPKVKDLEYHAQMSAEKAQFIDQDPVVLAARGRADVAEVLRHIKEQIACEQAAIHFQRIENEKYGKDTAQMSTRRIDALTKIAHIELEIKKMGGDLIDLRGERFQRVFALWISIIKDVASETMPPELIDLFFNRLSTAMEGWEDRATDNIR